LAEVRLHEGESFENARLSFECKVHEEDLVKGGGRHSFYWKSVERKRVKDALACERTRKKARKEQD
jgi:ribosomal protein S21